MFPSWNGGGWHSVPGVETPDGATTRVIVAQLGPQDFRWIGSSQTMDEVSDAPGDVAGARSGDGKTKILIGSSGFSAVHESGSSFTAAQDGTSTVLGSTVNVGASRINLFDGGEVPPTDGFILSTAFLATLAKMCADVISIGAGIPAGVPVLAPGAAELLLGIGSSQVNGLPYLSTRIFGS